MSNLDLKSKYDEERKSVDDRLTSLDGIFFGWSHENSNFDDQIYENAWKIALEVYPEIDHFRNELNKISETTSLAFCIFLLEHKQFENASAAFDEFREGFFTKYFGNDILIKRFAEKLFVEEEIDIAKKLNQTIRIIGTPSNTRQFLTEFVDRNSISQESYLYDIGIGLEIAHPVVKVSGIEVVKGFAFIFGICTLASVALIILYYTFQSLVS